LIRRTLAAQQHKQHEASGMAKKKPKKFDVPTEIRRLARERVGSVPSPKLIVPKKQRKKPKHKRPPGEETEETTG
jgi:hypothetical protein